MRDFDKDALKSAMVVRAFRELSMLHTAHSKMVAMLSTKLRLTPQSRYDRLKAGAALAPPHRKSTRGTSSYTGTVEAATVQRYTQFRQHWGHRIVRCRCCRMLRFSGVKRTHALCGNPLLRCYWG